jgi:hypothetical protein
MITLVTISHGVWARVLRCNAIVWKVFLIYTNRMFQHYKRLFSPLDRSTYNSSPCSCLPMLPPRECEAQGERVSDEQQKGVKHGAKEVIEKVRSQEHAQISSRTHKKKNLFGSGIYKRSIGRTHLGRSISGSRYPHVHRWIHGGLCKVCLCVCARSHMCECRKQADTHVGACVVWRISTSDFVQCMLDAHKPACFLITHFIDSNQDKGAKKLRSINQGLSSEILASCVTYM